MSVNNGNIKSEVLEKIFEVFEVFIDIYNDSGWTTKAVENDVKRAFQYAKFIETTCSQVEADGCSALFESKLEAWLKVTNTRNLNLRKLNTCCDLIITKILSDLRSDFLMMEVAVREYYTACGEQRLHSLLTQTMYEGALLQSAVRMLEKQNVEAVAVLEHEALMGACEAQLAGGNLKFVSDVIGKMLEDCDSVERIMKTMITASECESKRSLYCVILQMLLLKMNCIESFPSFWPAALEKTDNQLIVSVCKAYPDFLSALVSFIGSVGKIATRKYSRPDNALCVAYQWVIGQEPHSSGSTISFKSFSDLVHCLLASEGNVAEQMKCALKRLRFKSNCEFWNDICRRCESL